MPAPKLSVTVDALDEAATAFLHQHKALSDAITAFQGPALDVGEAFGFMGPSTDVLQKYMDLTEQACKGLDAVIARVGEATVALHATAKNYRQAERDSTVRGGGHG